MDDIAQHAGVSRATVSYVLNRRKRTNGTISEETQQRVLSAASALNYRTNELAKSMVTGKNRVLGVLMTPYVAEYNMRVLTGANEAADENGYLQKILHLAYTNVNKNVVARCQEWRLAGVMVFGFHEDQQSFLHDEFARVGMPVAMIDNAPSQSHWGARVRSDDTQGIPLVVTHLRELGHTHIGFLGGSPSDFSRWREEIFSNTLAEAGLPVRPQWIRQSDWNNQSPIEEAIFDVLRDPKDRPTAIACSSDSIAMVVLRVARSLGLRIPSDLSVTGYSNSNFSAFTDPPLTTVDQSFEGIGRAAALHLIGCAENPNSLKSDVPVEEILLPTKLVTRTSTAPPPSFAT